MTADDTHEKDACIALLENQIHDLKAQLEKAEARTKLINLVSAEKEEKRALMPPLD